MNNHKSLFLLFAANAISGFAQGISMLAIPWYFTANAQNSYFNFAYGLITLFVMFFGLYAGALIDKYNRKTNFLVTNLLCGIVLVLIAAYGYVNHQLPDIFVITVFGLTLLHYNIHYPTLYAIGQEIMPVQDYYRFNTNIEIVGQSMSILSGGFAALLLEGVSLGKGKLFGFDVNMPFAIARWDIWEIFMLNAFAYFMAVALIRFIRYTPDKQLSYQAGNLAERIRVGFSYLKQHPQFLIFGLFSYSVFAMLMVELHAVLPGYVERHLQEEGSVFAMADGIYAVGALCAGLFVNKVFSSGNTVKAVIILTLITSGIFFWTFASKSVLVIYLVSVILGFTNAGIRVLRLTFLFKHIPNELMGRVNSIFNMVNVLIRSLFIFLFSVPFFTFGSNVIWAWFIMAVFLLVSAIVLMLNYKKLKV